MDNRIIGIYLSRILSGFYIFIYKGQKYKLIYPNISVKYDAELYAEEEYENNKFNDWIQDDQIIDTLVSLGLWSYNGDESLKNIENQIEDLKIDLFKNFLSKEKTKSIRRTLDNTREAYNRQNSNRHSLDHLTVSGYINNIKHQYILVHSLYYDNNQPVFNIKEYVDYTLLNNLSSIIASNTIDFTTFRQIARSDNWRSYWSANKDFIFDKAAIDWTDEQRTLISISKMYDSAYQHPNCPQDNVINDDDMFDGWMILERRENEKNKNKNRIEKMLEGKNLSKANEVFLMADSQDEAKNIYGLNDNTSRHIIKERNKAIISSNKDIQEADLPDVQRNLVTQGNQQFINNQR